MNSFKAYEADDPNVSVYLASEVDEEIAELKKNIKYLEKELRSLATEMSWMNKPKITVVYLQHNGETRTTVGVFLDENEAFKCLDFIRNRTNSSVTSRQYEILDKFNPEDFEDLL